MWNACSSSASSGTTRRRVREDRALDGGESLEWCFGCGKCVPCVRRPRGGVRTTQAPPQSAARCRTCSRRRPVAVHHLHELPAGVPQGSRHDPDHAGRREVAVSEGHVPASCRTCSKRPSGTATASARTRASAPPGPKAPGVPVRVLPSEPGPVDVLFYVEDYWSFHPRGTASGPSVRAVASAVGVDFAILGAEEKTIGDSQRLAGEEGSVRSADGRRRRHPRQVRVRAHRHARSHGFNALIKEYPSTASLRRAALHAAARAARRPHRVEA